MQCTSTGLGKRKLQLNVLSAERADDTILVQAKSYAPVIWDIRVIVEPRDIPALIKLVLTRPVLGFMVRSLWSLAGSRFRSTKQASERDAVSTVDSRPSSTGRRP